MTIPAGARRLAVTVDGRQLSGWTWGAGKPVLLVHGWGGQSADMLPVASALSPESCSPVLVDMPAHGSSPGRETSLVEWMRVIRAIVATVGPLHGIVAHSLGATAAVLAAADGLPVDRLVLLAPAGSLAPYFAQYRQALGIKGRLAQRLVAEVERRVGLSIAQLDATRAAQRVSANALVLHGSDDRQIPSAQGRAVAEGLSAGQFVERPGLKHRTLLSDPESIRLVTEFLCTATLGTTTVSSPPLAR
ncbi:MAG: alpha/beta fold hydrolase [bacterium]